MVLFGESANIASRAREFDLFPRGILSKRSTQSRPYVSEEGMKSDDAFSSSGSTKRSVRTDDAPPPKTKRKRLVKLQNKYSFPRNGDAQKTSSAQSIETTGTNTPPKRFSLTKYFKGDENLLQRLKRNYSDTALVKSRSGSVLDLSKNKSEPALSNQKGEKPSFRLSTPPASTLTKSRDGYAELMTGADSATSTLADSPALPSRSVEGEVTSRRLGQLKGMLDSHHRDYMSGEQIANIQRRIKEMETALGTPLETRIHRLQKYRDNPKFKLSQAEKNRIQARIDDLEIQRKQHKPQDKTQKLLDAVSERLDADIKKGAIDPQSVESSQSTKVNSPGYQTPGKLTPETPKSLELETMSLSQVKRMTWSDLTLALVAHDKKAGHGAGKQLLMQKIPGTKTTFGHVFRQKQQEAYVEAKARRLLEQEGVPDSPIPTLKIREYSKGKDMLQQWQTEAEHLYPIQSKAKRFSW